MWQKIKDRFNIRATFIGILVISVWVGLSLTYENSSDSGIAGRKYIYQSQYIKELVGQPESHILLGADFKRSRLSQCGYLRYLVLGSSGVQTFSIRLTKNDEENWTVKEIKEGLYPVFENTCYK